MLLVGGEGTVRLITCSIHLHVGSVLCSKRNGLREISLIKLLVSDSLQTESAYA
jgi:hypothetical protein